MKRLFILLMIIWSAQIGAYDELHLKRFKTLNKCPGCDLSGADFSNLNLRRADLSGADLRNVNFTEAHSAGGMAYSADFRGAIFVGEVRCVVVIT